MSIGIIEKELDSLNVPETVIFVIHFHTFVLFIFLDIFLF